MDNLFNTSHHYYDAVAYATLRPPSPGRGNSAGSPPASPRGSSSFSTHALLEALPSLPSQAASPEPQWSSEVLSAHDYGNAGGVQENHGWHGAWHRDTGGNPYMVPVEPAWQTSAWAPVAHLHASAAPQPFPSEAVLRQRAQEWHALCSETLKCEGKDERLTQALADLFRVFVDSPTFRRTMATIERDGPLRIRIDPEVATAHFNSGKRAIAVGAANAGSRVYAMSMLAFELTNASLASDFSAHARQAVESGLHPSAYADGVERIEYNSLSNCHAYYLEARQSLQRAGLDNPEAWFSRTTPYGDIQPLYASAEEYLAVAQATGHFGQYEQDYVSRR